MRRALKRKFIKYYPSKRYKYKFFANILDLIYMKLSPDKEFAQNQFKSIFGYDLDLENPKTFNEKIHWLKIYDRTKLHTLCADKLAVREYIKEQLGEAYLIPLIFATQNPLDLTPEKLPDSPFIIKSNHDSGSYQIIKNKKDINWNLIQNKFREALAANYYFTQREWQYKNIKPFIIVEELLSQENGDIPYDYKFHCCNGKVNFIQVDMDKEANHTRNLYDVKWDLLPFNFRKNNGPKTLPPRNLSTMIDFAEKLSLPFAFARIDFYEVDEKVFFSEITFHPNAGLIPFSPKNWDLILGEKINLPINS